MRLNYKKAITFLSNGSSDFAYFFCIFYDYNFILTIRSLSLDDFLVYNYFLTFYRFSILF